MHFMRMITEHMTGPNPVEEMGLTLLVAWHTNEIKGPE